MVKYCHLERTSTRLSEVLGTGETAAALVQGVHTRWAAYWGLKFFFSELKVLKMGFGKTPIAVNTCLMGCILGFEETCLHSWVFEKKTLFLVQNLKRQYTAENIKS